jgi:hypothetical protein
MSASSRNAGGKPAAVGQEMLEAWLDVRRSWNDPSRHEHALHIARRDGGASWLASRNREIARRGDQVASERIVDLEGARQSGALVTAPANMLRLLFAMSVLALALSLWLRLG